MVTKFKDAKNSNDYKTKLNIVTKLKKKIVTKLNKTKLEKNSNIQKATKLKKKL